MQAVLISIQPKWCELIASGDKTIEVRKTVPKLERPFKCYIYCTISNGAKGDYLVPSGIQCGKVIGEFVCDKIEQGHILWVKEQAEYYDKVEEKTQLTYRQMFDYLGESGVGYFWHISNLVIYKQPKELSEFRKKCEFAYSSYEEGTCYEDCIQGKLEDCRCFCLPIRRPPQSWCYVDGKEG